ncbi:MAG TPA: 2-oxoacid:acceptor oxidoreductase family protein [Solirubrobacteraceae bacterium]|nr:2-oxoacid:acceptor oxidoreductase family protein [Solirubrobacteraceae bacterium]
MLQLRFHGRGGQGVVTSAELLAVAAFIDGRHAQAFPSFGSERMGAPVQAFCRIDDAPIRAHEPVSRPDVLVIQDPTLLHHVDVFAGLAADGFVLLNSRHGAAPLGDAELPLPTGHVRALPATDLALEHLGRPLPGPVLLGALAALTHAVRLGSLTAAVEQRFIGATAEGNVAAATAGWEHIGAAAHA